MKRTELIYPVRCLSTTEEFRKWTYLARHCGAAEIGANASPAPFQTNNSG